MELLKIVYLSLGSLVVLFILAKLMGNREISQLSIFDYITSITIGSIAAEMATSLENNFMEPLIAMIVYAVVSIIIAVLTSHSIKFRRFIMGNTLILFRNGNLNRKNFKKSKLDINEFLMQCRTNGFFNLDDIHTAILETNGKISFLPKSLKRPATPEDLNLNPKQEDMATNIISDGIILYENLKSTGNNETWLKNNLKSYGISNPKDVFLATCDNENTLNVYTKLEKESRGDIFK